MSDPILTKTFTQIDIKRFGCCAIFLCFIIFMAISSSPKPRLRPMSLIGDDDGTTSTIRSSYFDNAGKMKEAHAMCRDSIYCEMEGDIRIEANSTTIHVIISSSNSTKSWSIAPCPRKGRRHVRKWRVTVGTHTTSVPKCSQHHDHPAILFSTGGHSRNFYHAFADVMFPVYLTSSEFQRQVQFLATDYDPWWIRKYTQILSKLTKHDILDIDGETSQVHCYTKIRIGLKFYKVLMSNPSQSPPSMHAFRVMLREAYSLKRERVGPATSPGLPLRQVSPQAPDSLAPAQQVTPPCLMIIDRKYTRVLTNVRQVSRVATEMGFEVVVAEPEHVAEMSGTVEAVNSCDALMGVHGAGLTNMLFLPDKAVLIEVIPFGNVETFGRGFVEASSGMNLSYLGYKIEAKESSLSQKYSIHHPFMRDPDSYTTLDKAFPISMMRNQNVTLDVGRFKHTLVKALELLQR